MRAERFAQRLGLKDSGPAEPAVMAAKKQRGPQGPARSMAKVERRRLRPANALFEEVGVPQPRELDREAVLEVAHHAALDGAERD